MLGAIIGDIAGSRFEFHNLKSKDFELFHATCRFTDDTVLTVAVADTLIGLSHNDKGMGENDAFRERLILRLDAWARRYWRAGYGQRFFQWMRLPNGQKRPYGSWGNGAAMRVSPIAYYARTMEEALTLAKLSATVTHDHPEAVKSAECVAGLIWLGKQGADKSELMAFARKYYNMDFTLDEIRPFYKHTEKAEESVPQAIASFEASADFEDTVRNAISIGGDSDTIAAIAGSIAEAYYDIPPHMVAEARSYLTEDILKVVDLFDSQYRVRG